MEEFLAGSGGGLEGGCYWGGVIVTVSIVGGWVQWRKRPVSQTEPRPSTAGPAGGLHSPPF